MSATNWRGLCEELVLLDTEQPTEYADWKQRWNAVIKHARAVLAADADGPAVPDGREPASVVDEPSNEELLEINDGAYCPGTNEVNDDDDSSWQYTSDHIRWLDENGTPQEQAAYAVKGLRAVFEAGRRWGSPAPVPAGEVAELVAWLRNMANADLGGIDELNADRAADLLQRQATACAICERERLHQSTRAADLEVERQAAPVPVAVSDRLPQPEDCDAEGRCWWGRPESDDWSADWTLATPEAIAEFCEFSPRVTWLPFNALPLPQGGQ